MIHSPITPIFTAGVFDTHSSLAEKIHRLSDPKIELTPQGVADMVASYVFGYIYPESTDTKVSEGDLNEFFNRAHTYHRLYRGQKKQEGEFESQYGPYQYQVGMAGDIAATVEILLDILQQKVPKNMHVAPVNVEVGTGTGILQVGRHIWGRRRGYEISAENNIGFEVILDVIIRTDAVLRKLGIGTIKMGDTTDIQTFENSGIPREVDFFSNENLPRHGYRLTQEPFLRNMLSFARYIGFENFAKVHMFPYLSKFFDTKTQQEYTVGIALQKDVEFLALLEARRPDFEADMRSIGLSVGEIFYPDQGHIGDQFIVGRSKKGFICEFPYWYHRWKKDNAKK